MDEESLNAFGSFTNFGYHLGFIPYHFSRPHNVRPSAVKTTTKKVKGQPRKEKNAWTHFHPQIERKRWILDDSSTCSHLHHCNFVMTWLYVLFLATRTVQTFLDNNVRIGMKLEFLSVFFTYLAGSYGLWQGLDHYGKIGNYLNFIVETAAKLKGHSSYTNIMPN